MKQVYKPAECRSEADSNREAKVFPLKPSKGEKKVTTKWYRVRPKTVVSQAFVVPPKPKKEECKCGGAYKIKTVCICSPKPLQGKGKIEEFKFEYKKYKASKEQLRNGSPEYLEFPLGEDQIHGQIIDKLNEAIKAINRLERNERN